MLGIILILILLLFLRLGGRARYSDEGFHADLKVGPFHKQLFPRQEKTQKQKEAKQQNIGGSLGLLKELLPELLDTVGDLKRKVRIDH
ncbi:MAG: hypothetical protein IJX72_01985, partial [Clostridia bacterium]|nr:hypothetical protein [Clostridia bacterium]